MLEHGLVNFIGFSRLIAANERTSEALTVDPWTKEFKRVFSEIVKRFKSRVQIADDLADRLAECVDNRNFLAHSYWRERVEWTVDNTGRQNILDETDAMRQKFEAVDAEVSALFFDMAERYGITPEAVRAHYSEMVARMSSKET